MVGGPPDVRALTEHLICALAVLELQSTGARSHVANFSLRSYDTQAKNEQKPPTNAGRRHHRTKSTEYVEHLELCEIGMSLKGWGT